MARKIVEWWATLTGRRAMSAEDLINAAMDGDAAIVQALLVKGADVNAKIKENYADTALMQASQNGHLNVVQTLLDNGAEVNARGDIYGETALIFASRNGHHEVVQALLDRRAEVDARERHFGETALMAASQNGHLNVVQALLDKGANVNVKENRGSTALMWASYEGRGEIVQALLDKGADVNAKADDGDTALMKASREGHHEVVQALLDKGAEAKDAMSPSYGRKTNMNARVATGRIGNMPIYKIDPQSWAHGADVLHYLFVDRHCRTLKDHQFWFLGCDGIIYSVEEDDVLLHISKREASPLLRCGPGRDHELFDSENPLHVYPLRDVEHWQYLISEELEGLNRNGYNAILPEQYDLVRNDAGTFQVSLSSLDLQEVTGNISELSFSLPDFPAGLSDVQSLFLERVLGGAYTMKAVRYERGDDWRKVVISFPSKSKVIGDLKRAQAYRTDIPAIGYGFGIGVDRNSTQMNVTLSEPDLYTLPFSLIGTA